MKCPFQAASSSSGGLEQLQVLKELAAADGKDRVESAVKGLPRDILRQVIVAAKLPPKSKWGVADTGAIAICFAGLFIEPARGARGGGLGSNLVPCHAWLLCI